MMAYCEKKKHVRNSPRGQFSEFAFRGWVCGWTHFSSGSALMNACFLHSLSKPNLRGKRLPALPTRGRPGLSPGSGDPLESKVTSSTLVPTVIPAGVDSGEGNGLLWLLVLLDNDAQSYFTQAESHPCPRPPIWSPSLQSESFLSKLGPLFAEMSAIIAIGASGGA